MAAAPDLGAHAVGAVVIPCLVQGDLSGLTLDGMSSDCRSSSCIGRSNLSGTGLLPNFMAVGLVAQTALDSTHIFWSHFDNTGDSVGRANLDGTAANGLFITGASSPTGVAIQRS